MTSGRGSWAPVTDGLPILTYTYGFGSGIANAFAVPCTGGIAIVSPPCKVPDSTFDDIEKHGKVRALVAPNAYHNLGLPAWKARFPDAQIFAPVQSIARVGKKTRLGGIKPLSEIGSLAGPDLELIDMPHYKTGEVLVRVRSGREVAWCITDVMMNLPALPPAFPIRQIFKWTKTAPGLRPNAIAGAFMMKDKRAVYRWLRAEIAKAPPTVLVAAHGDHILGDAADRMLEALPS